MSTWDVQHSYDFARRLYLDIDTVDQAIDNTVLLDMLNDYYHRWMVQYSQETIAETALSFIATSKFKVLTPTNNEILKWVRVELAGAILRNAPMDELRNKQLTLAETGTPREWAWERVGIPTGNGGFPVTYNIYVYPIPTGPTTVTVYTVSAPDTLVAVGDLLRVTEADGRLISRMVAAEASSLIGREDAFTQMILAPIPEGIQAEMGLVSSMNKPKAPR